MVLICFRFWMTSLSDWWWYWWLIKHKDKLIFSSYAPYYDKYINNGHLCNPRYFISCFIMELMTHYGKANYDHSKHCSFREYTKMNMLLLKWNMWFLKWNIWSLKWNERFFSFLFPFLHLLWKLEESIFLAWNLFLFLFFFFFSFCLCNEKLHFQYQDNAGRTTQSD